MQTARKEYESIDKQAPQETTELKRSLKSRHLTMISLGGTIGTGLFLASGGAIHAAGPGGAILSYLVIGVMVYFLMQSL
ncbi:MAG: gamma-aminobutyrate permease, partial [Bacillus sp. (in: firmicutes)]